MGLTKRKDGWYVEFPVIDDGKTLTLARGTPGARIKRWKTAASNKTVAKQQEAKIKTDLMMGKVRSEKTKRLFFAEWGEMYLSLEEVKGLRSYRDRVSAIRGQFIPYFGKKPLDDLSPSDVETFRSQRQLPNGETPSLSTVNYDHAILKHCLSLAVRRDLVSTNVAKKVTLPTPDNERDRVLRPEEWERLYAAAADHLKPILLVAYQLGMRQREILDLTWDRVDLQRGFIKLRGSDTKAKEGRVVPLTPAVWESWQELSRVRQIHCPFVFQYEGHSLQRVKRGFRNACRRAGIEGFRFHDLRHCAATNLRRAGVDTVTAMKIIGHKSEKMYCRYNSVSEADLTKAASKINTYLTPGDSAGPATAISR
ncbi:MAG: tyrosine-type recombinase/integrase [Nitrospirota bacterium]|nr:tyrosine-type recombinase/integrase [Nitrospirota bacterium]